MSEPTNADIFQAIGKLGARLDSVEDTMVGVHEQTKKTNGRVNALERRNEIADGIVAWQEKNGPKLVPTEAVTAVSSGSSIDFTKIILGLIGLCGTAVAIISVIVNKL